MSKTQKKRCPYCGFLDAIKKGNTQVTPALLQVMCQLFTDKRTAVTLKNKEVWFREWIIGKQYIEQLAQRSGYSVRHLKTYFYEMLPRYPV